MSFEFSPSEIAQMLIEDAGIDPEEAYNEQGGLVRAQLTAVAAASNALGTQTYTDSDGKEHTTTLKKNVYNTINRLSKSANKKNIDFNANIKNTMYNTVQFAVMEQVEQIPKAKQKETMIKWLPSTANEADPFHALNYGKTMTLDSALSKGLGTRYGCQCSMLVLESPEDVETNLKDISE